MLEIANQELITRNGLGLPRDGRYGGMGKRALMGKEESRSMKYRAKLSFKQVLKIHRFLNLMLQNLLFVGRLYMDCSLSTEFSHVVNIEWVATPFRGSSDSRD